MLDLKIFTGDISLYTYFLTGSKNDKIQNMPYDQLNIPFFQWKLEEGTGKGPPGGDWTLK